MQLILLKIYNEIPNKIQNRKKKYMGLESMMKLQLTFKMKFDTKRVYIQQQIRYAFVIIKNQFSIMHIKLDSSK